MNVWCPHCNHVHRRLGPSDRLVCPETGQTIGPRPGSTTVSADLDFFWQYCCSCRTFQPSRLEQPRGEKCESCAQLAAVRYWCERCGTLSFNSLNGSAASPLERIPRSCSGCRKRIDPVALSQHYCEAYQTTLFSAFETCPRCGQVLTDPSYDDGPINTQTGAREVEPQVISSATIVAVPETEPILVSRPADPENPTTAPEQVFSRNEFRGQIDGSHFDELWRANKKVIVYTALAPFLVATFILFGLIPVWKFGVLPAWKYFARDRGNQANQNNSPPVLKPPGIKTSLPTPSPTMVRVPRDSFKMGRDEKDGGDAFESPAHDVTVGPFLIDIHEVTREEYKTCVEAKKCAAPAGWNGSAYPANTGRLPVTGITWEDANTYAQSVGKRLPTEAEWEYAARGKDGRLYPWSNDWKPELANTASDRLAEVETYKGISPFGLFDMLGNAQEWTASEVRAYGGNQRLLKPRSHRIIRGGNHLTGGIVTATYRDALITTEARAYYQQTGFRCVQDVKQN
jgi:formylglycine-generating enzyme required for sulfatase activity